MNIRLVDYSNSMIDEMNLWLLGGGLCVGLAFGALVQHFRFCMVAMVGNLLLMRDFRHVHAFFAAWLVAIAGTQLLAGLDMVAVADSGYRNGQLDWAGAVLGGLVFGFGALLAGGCAGRTIVRVAEGSVSALMALVFFASGAALTKYGPLESARLALTESTAIDLASGDASLMALTGLPLNVVTIAIVVMLFVLLIVTGGRTRDVSLIMAGAGIGALVVAGWWITGNLAQDMFEPVPPSSISISGPIAHVAYAATTDKRLVASFAVMFVTGTLAGAFLMALKSGLFKISVQDKAALLRASLGGLMMGIGAMLAGGCNIGQGLSGVSTLSVESILAAICIFMGAALGVKWLEGKD